MQQSISGPPMVMAIGRPTAAQENAYAYLNRCDDYCRAQLKAIGERPAATDTKTIQVWRQTHSRWSGLSLRFMVAMGSIRRGDGINPATADLLKSETVRDGKTHPL